MCLYKRGSIVSLCLSLAFGLFACLLPAAHAQVGATSSVAGQVTDKAGLAVPGATVTLTDPSTKAAHTEVTNEAGRYIFTNVLPSVYSLTVARDGFQTEVVERQQVLVNVPVTLNFALPVGSVSQSVTVTSVAGAELQTSNSTMGTTLEGSTLLLLPNIGRDASALVTYQAGVTSGGNVAGQANDTNTFMVDGANNSDDMAGGNNVYTTGFGGATNGTVPTPAESVEEFKVNTNNQTADFYSSSGAQVQLVTKRGTDTLHGAFYDFYQGSFMNANSYINNFNHTKRQDTHQNRFGIGLGGALTHRNFLGGKTYLYGFYEGRRLPQALTFVRQVPSDLMRAGVLEFLDASNNPVYYNLNPGAATVNGTTYAGSALDPRGIGLNSQVNTIWSKYMPHSNYKLAGDQINTVGFQGQINSPVSDNTEVARMDHDFGQRWHLMASYRLYKLSTFNTAQTDIGGFVNGDTLGQIKPIAVRPVEPSLIVVNFAGNITQNLTNNFSWNYTRNWWSWNTAGAPPQVAGNAASLEIGGESNNALIPVNVDAQDARARTWNGHDFYYKDDLSLLHRNHFFQFGGQFQDNRVYHSRNDNGTTVINALVNLVGTGQNSAPSISFTGYTPTICSSSITTNCLPSSQIANYENDYAEVLGMVSQSQELATRQGSNLNLQPLGTPLFDQDSMPSYDGYFSDVWQITKGLTLSYGLNYGIQLPPTEKNGKQVMLVDGSGKPYDVFKYFQARDAAAAQGQFTSTAFNPEIGFENIGNTGRKYPFDPFYGGVGPHVSAAWNPSFKNGWMAKAFGNNSTVIRGGYARIYGRLNGVRLVLIPLLGVGFGQTVTCQDPLTPGATPAGGSACTGQNGSSPLTAFREGTDGATAPLPVATQTLPQPIFPGVAGQPKTGAQLQLAPDYRPESSDQFNFTIQRQLPKNVLLEVGYLGVLSHNLYTDINMDEVPYMSAVNGQSFASAYAAVELAQMNKGTATPQAFFEGALSGSAYCAGYSSCTAAIVAKQAANLAGQYVSNIWSALSPNFNPGIFPAFNANTGSGGTMPGLDQAQALDMDTSVGWSNYNAGFISVQRRSTNGLTINANITYSHALSSVQSATGQSGSGNSPSNPLDLGADYGDTTFDQRLHFNLLGLYPFPFFRTQQGIAGHVLGGWSFAPIFTVFTGTPIQMRGGSSQEFGQGFAEALDSDAILTGGKSSLPGQSIHKRTSGSGGVGTNGYGVNLFSNPAGAFPNYRAPILGFDTRGGGNGSFLRNPVTSNLDFTLAKDTRFFERFGATFQASVFNAFNHTNWSATTFSLANPAGFGVLTPAATPRSIELGLRMHF